MNMISAQRIQKLSLLASLYVSQFLPFWFLFEALPVILRQRGLSLAAIGLLPMLLLPIAFKFLWSPVIDFYGFTRWGHYRFWIICFQSGVIGVTVFCSFLSVEHNLPVLLVGLALMALLCSSQDIATDALALGLLSPRERGVGNAVQGIGGSLGKMIGGGGMLILLNKWGWSKSLLTLAALMLLALMPLLWHRETIRPMGRVTGKSINPALDPLIAYCKIFIESCQRPGIRIWLLTLAVITAGYNFSAAMFRPLLVDLGFSIADIGRMIGIFGIAMTMLGSAAAGLLMAKLGRQRALLIAANTLAVGTFSNVLLTYGFTQLPVLNTIIGVTFFAFGILGTTAFTIMMDKSRIELAGTDYTLQTSVIALCSILSAALGGVIASIVGYRGIFILSTGILLNCNWLIVQHLDLNITSSKNSETYDYAHH
ncbi:MFS transporter [Acaryochloris marina]|uniref:Major facilitator family transporter n=1 Tax=Acaryochloris marina (strain MBIC 11017) TaxID=329726 RepID=A8ZKS3_ACAM1|nr:MFS transporter [Acaryochloris marina]ABW31391.1 major facilitator family transporter [Acaryochloris marina MBIC11017]